MSWDGYECLKITMNACMLKGDYEGLKCLAVSVNVILLKKFLSRKLNLQKSQCPIFSRE